MSLRTPLVRESRSNAHICLGDDDAQRNLSSITARRRVSGQGTHGRPRHQVGKGSDRITHPRQSAQRSGQPTIRAMSPLEHVLLTRTRSAESMMASGNGTCRNNRPHRWQLRPAVRKKIKNPLPTASRPQMARLSPEAPGKNPPECRFPDQFPAETSACRHKARTLSRCAPYRR